MLAGLPYKAWLDGLAEERLESKKRIYKYNNLPPEAEKEQEELIKEILGKTGENVHIEAPFHCDYGYNIEVGENFFANYNLTVLDVGKVRIGKNAQIAPNVSIYTAGHRSIRTRAMPGMSTGLKLRLATMCGSAATCA